MRLAQVFWVGLFASFVFAPQSLAQTRVPSSADPSRIEKRFEQPRVPRSREEPLIPESEQPLPPEEAEKISFTLRDIELIDVTVYEPAELRPLYESRLNQPSSLSVVYEIADEIAAKYRNDGYVLVQVFPPAQDVPDGVVRLQVIEGFIHKIEVEGDVGPHKPMIDAYAAKILKSRPLRNEVLERYLLLANDLPGVEARAILLPSFEQPGASDLVLQVTRLPYEVTAQVDNRGTRFIGALQNELRGRLNGAISGSDMAEGRVIVTGDPDELQYYEIGYERVVGSEGTKIGVSGIASDSEPGFSLEPFDIDSRNQTLTLSASHDLKRSRRFNLGLRGELTYRNTTTNLLGSRLSEDRLRIASLGLTVDRADAFKGINLLDLELSQGLDILGERGNGKPHLTRTSGRTDFTKLTLEASRL